MKSPQGLVCAAGALLGTQKQHPILVQNQHPSCWAFQPLRLLSSGQAPCPLLFGGYLEGQMKQNRQLWGAVAVQAWSPLLSYRVPCGPFSNSVSDVSAFAVTAH